MGIFRPVIQAFVRAMLDAGHNILPGPAVGPQFVGDHDPGCMALCLQQLTHQPLRSLGISAALHEHVEDETFLVDGPPQPLLLTGNGDHAFVQMPSVTKSPR